MSFISFIKSKTFRNHFLLAVALIIAFLWFSLKALDMYTRHGKTITVPDLESMPTEEAIHELEELNLRAVVNDSIFDDTREKGTIASQNPAAGVDVKRNRTVYITTVAILPEMIAMPDLTDLSLRQAQAQLKTYGLRIGKLDHVPHIARNAVLEQKYNEGSIQPGTMVEKGTEIDLVLGTGETQTYTHVPMVIGQPRQQAIQLINAASLNVGEEIFPEGHTESDHENLKVYMQSPDATQSRPRLELGATVNLEYRSAYDFDFEEYTSELLSIENPDLYGKTPREVLEALDDAFLILGDEVFDNNVPINQARVYRQDPDPDESPTLSRGTRIDVWYKNLEDMGNDE